MAKKQQNAEYCNECHDSAINFRNEATCKRVQDDDGFDKVLTKGSAIPSWCTRKDAKEG